ncbi:nucleotidyl transferase AbiEii/AbiGii toxin family protein [candidate division WOR-3 bacterium]|nr:nucleotidyl transferase AbiEii/AbiGii toxin family protein [candidate division WOR-3 bacterium]
MKTFENAILESLRTLLESLNSEIKRWNFYLVGGSGLALQIGHRVSEDLDFFTPENFSLEVLIQHLRTRFSYQETLVSSGTLYCNLNQIKVSFLYYEVPLVYPKINYKKVEIADWRDILAEKFKTLSQRGNRKDFYDIYFTLFLKNITIGESIETFKKRFKGTGINYYHILKSLVFFEEAEQEPELLLLKEVSWETVKTFFINNLREFEKHLLKVEDE